MTEQGWEKTLADQLGPLHLPRAYCPTEPTAKQEWFLRRNEFEAFFGGAAGPGKSWGLLMAALQYVDVPGYDALLLRPTLSEFEQHGGLIDVSHDWLDHSDAWWHGGRREWAFPSGATVRFGYLANPGHVRQYKGAAYSFVGFDELTGFPYDLYRSMFRLLRQPAEDGAGGAGDDLAGVPLRMRGASNPGDVGHTWVKTRFVDPKTREPGAVFVPATVDDNPHLNYTEYLKSLQHMSPIDRERLIRGDWDVMEEGGKFDRDRFIVVEPDQAPAAVKAVRYWDLAATEVGPSSPDPDYTVGLRLETSADGHFTIRHIARGRWPDHVVEQMVRTHAVADGRSVPVYIEQEPGASGKSLVSHYKRNVLQGYPTYSGMPRGGDKEVRSRPVAAAVANDLVRIVRGKWLLEFLDEASLFPQGDHDDQVDALSGAHRYLTARGLGQQAQTSKPVGRIPGVSASGLQFRG